MTDVKVCVNERRFCFGNDIFLAKKNRAPTEPLSGFWSAQTTHLQTATAPVGSCLIDGPKNGQSPTGPTDNVRRLIPALKSKNLPSRFYSAHIQGTAFPLTNRGRR